MPDAGGFGSGSIHQSRSGIQTACIAAVEACAHSSLFTYPFFLIKLRKRCAFQLGDTSWTCSLRMLWGNSCFLYKECRTRSWQEWKKSGSPLGECQWPPSFTPRAFPTGVPCSSSRHNFAQYTYSVPLFRSCNNKLLITKHPSSRSIKMMSSCVSNWLRKSSLNVFLSIACVSISLGSTSSMVTRTGFPLAYK